MSMPSSLEESLNSQGKVVLTVSQFSQVLQKNLQDTMPFIWVSGELSGIFHAQSGHVYATIKDATSQMKIVIYQFVRKGIAFDITEGLHVHIGVQPALYKPRGELQLIVKAMEPEGLGSLQLAFEQIRAKLLTEGLFDANRKKLLPKYPKSIAVITSKDGAVWHDILKVIERRYPIVPVILYPCSVQGPNSVKEIVTQIQLAGHQHKADVYILARGGGSLTDLWSFNTEEVVRAIAAFPWPLVSAIGHETDVTLTDFVADLRAPTPSIAAELVTPSISEIFHKLDHLKSRIHNHLITLKRHLEYRCDRLEQSWSSPSLGMNSLIHQVDKASLTLKASFVKAWQEQVQHLYKIDCAFQSVLKRLEQDLQKKNIQCVQIVQKNTHFLEKKIHNLHAKVLSLEQYLLSKDPNKDLLPLSVIDRAGRLVLKAESVTPNMPATLSFPDGQWSIRFLKPV